MPVKNTSKLFLPKRPVRDATRETEELKKKKKKKKEDFEIGRPVSLIHPPLNKPPGKQATGEGIGEPRKHGLE
jgi:hypothetical protein